MRRCKHPDNGGTTRSERHSQWQKGCHVSLEAAPQLTNAAKNDGGGWWKFPSLAVYSNADHNIVRWIVICLLAKQCSNLMYELQFATDTWNLVCHLRPGVRRQLHSSVTFLISDPVVLNNGSVFINGSRGENKVLCRVTFHLQRPMSRNLRRFEEIPSINFRAKWKDAKS